MIKPFKIGTRGSKLALWQAEHVRGLLIQNNPKVEFEISIIKTIGDERSQEENNKPIDGKNVFIKEIEEALISGRIDLAVHSLKDMSATITQGLSIFAYIGGAGRNDSFISSEGLDLKDLHVGARIGTSSARRASQLRIIREDFNILPIRGNVDTRLRKLDDGQYDGIILAQAGLERLGLSDKISYCFSNDEIVPAAGQGVIAVQARDDDKSLSDAISKINNEDSESVAKIEFEFMKIIGADCNVPLGVNAQINNKNVYVSVFLSSLNEEYYVKVKKEFDVSQINNISSDLASEVKTIWKNKTGKELIFNE